MSTIKELLTGTELAKRANILILDEVNAIAVLEDKDKNEFECHFYFLKADNNLVYITEEYGMDKSTLKIVYNSNLSSEGVIALEDKGGVTIYDYISAKPLVLDNMYNNVYDSYVSAYDSESEPNFAVEDDSRDNFGKYLVCSIVLEREYPKANYGLIQGHVLSTFYTKFYYGRGREFTPLKLYESIEDLKMDNAFLDLGCIKYEDLIKTEESENPMLKAIAALKERLDSMIKPHNNCLILIEEAKENLMYGSMSEDVKSFEKQVKLVLK